MGGAEYNWGVPMTLNNVHAFETGLDPHPANFVPLSPVSFLNRAASAFADKVAVIDGPRSFTYAQLLDRCVRLASALTTLGVGRLDTVAIIASNIPEMIEAHFAVPMLGAVLNPLNTRLDAANIAFSLMHGSDIRGIQARIQWIEHGAKHRYEIGRAHV